MDCFNRTYLFFRDYQNNDKPAQIDANLWVVFHLFLRQVADSYLQGATIETYRRHVLVLIDLLCDANHLNKERCLNQSHRDRQPFFSLNLPEEFQTSCWHYAKDPVCEVELKLDPNGIA